MSQKRLNVLVLTVDALRADRLSVYGYERPTTPVLERLAGEAIVCDNALTLGPFTQIACIQLFTSSRPFDYGGYDKGAVGRPETLFQCFRNAGYDTWGLSTIHWVSPYYGYTDGLDTQISVFHLNTLVGMAIVNMRDTLDAYRIGKIPAEELLARVTPVIEKLFRNVVDYCHTLEKFLPSYAVDFPDFKMVNDGYDLDKVRRITNDHRRAFERDPLNYVHRHLTTPPEPHEWLAKAWFFSRTPAKLLSEGVFRISNLVLRLLNPRLAYQRASRIRLSVDAHAISDKVIDHLQTRDSEKPFFIWAHFKDTHRPFVSGPGKSWYRHTPDYLEALGYPRDLDPTLSFRVHHAKSDGDRETLSALYDAAVRSTDEAVGKILTTLDDLDLTDDTVVAFCGDHGEEIGDHGDYGHQCMSFEHNARVPMIFKPAGSREGWRNESLVCSIDWGPTIADLAGLQPVPGWEGVSVTSKESGERDHIIFENFCRGNCIFEHRPVYMGVRTASHKYLWKEYVDPYDTAGIPGPMLYDLTADPLEQQNIYDPDHPLVREFNRLIAERLANIPEISSARIVNAFGSVGENAVRRTRAEVVNS